MTVFLRLLQNEGKSNALLQASAAVRKGAISSTVYNVDVAVLSKVPGSPFAYWISENVRAVFQRIRSFEQAERTARAGLQTSDDFRFLRAKWEVESCKTAWIPLAKGGSYSPFYADIFLTVNWAGGGREIANFSSAKTGKVISYIRNPDFYFRSGLFQTLRAAKLAPHLTPPGCIFGDNGTQAFCDSDSLLALLSLLNSSSADSLHKLLLGRAGYALYRNGTLSRLPTPSPDANVNTQLAEAARESWQLRRTLDSTNETSNAFLLPARLRDRIGGYDPIAIDRRLSELQAEIDTIAFDLYGFNDEDRAAVSQPVSAEIDSDVEADNTDSDAEDNADDADEEEITLDGQSTLLSWAFGVAFGRFDLALATKERVPPPPPGPLEALLPKSVGMLPDGVTPFHIHAGILVDDIGHPHDVVRLVEEVLTSVNATVNLDVRRWLQREFFDTHLKRYSKSRRKAPIYWPLSTTSGSYTLWIYYPGLSSETLYTAINDFVEPKLKYIGDGVTSLRNKGSARDREEEKQFEILQASELELIELRDTLLKLAPTYKPSHNDGVQISAAPLWQLFRHKDWQKVLKDTWGKLEKGDYDWAHLALNYWPGRVREKCKFDRSLAIAHGLEELYIEPEAKPKKTRGKKKAGVMNEYC